MDTPNGGAKIKSYEFTPIGHVNARDRSDELKENGVKRSLENGNLAFAERKKPRNPSVADETFNSTRLFNDTSFDETMPEPILHERRPNSRKNVMNDLLITGQDATENLTSNPLKETESTLKKLQMENYNLRIKCASLLKFLNNISDDGEIVKNLEILDELNDLKVRYQQMSQDYSALQLKFDKLGDYDEDREELIKVRQSTSKLEEQLRVSKDQLEKAHRDLQQTNDTIKSLESRVMKMTSEQKEKDQQHDMKVSVLQSQINELTTSLSTKEKECADLRDKTSWLTSQLQEFDHQNGSLLNMQSTLDSKNEAIRNLEAQLQRNEHKRQSLEREVSLLQDELKSLRDTHKKIIDHKDQQIKQLTDSLSSNDVDNLRRMEDLSAEKRKLSESNRLLEDSETELKQTVKSLESELDRCRKEFAALQNSHHQKLEEVKKLQVLHHSSPQEDTTKHELLELRKQNDLLKTENNSLSRRLNNMIRQSPSKKAVEADLSRKNSEISSLQSTIQDLEFELRETRSTISNLNIAHRQEIEKLLKGQSNASSTDLSEEKKRLQTRVSQLELELDSLRDTKEKELSMWKKRYDAVRTANEELLRETKNQSGLQSNLSNEKDKEILQLQTNYNKILTERSSLVNELSKLKSHKDEYKEDLRKAQSRLEFITKEFVKLRDSVKHEQNQDTSEAKDLLNSKWYSKYQAMKSRFLGELKALQDENLELQKIVLQKKSESNGATAAFSSAVQKGTLQDEIDYYRLKYLSEVKQNNDLKVINEYLNRVLKASSQHVKLDILKLQNEVPSYDLYADLPFRPSSKVAKKVKFRSVALLVLSCVRMKNTIDRRKWDRQQLEFLKRKIILNQDRISW